MLIGDMLVQVYLLFKDFYHVMNERIEVSLFSGETSGGWVTWVEATLLLEESYPERPGLPGAGPSQLGSLWLAGAGRDWLELP